jgi:hypothetical protein
MLRCRSPALQRAAPHTCARRVASSPPRRPDPPPRRPRIPRSHMSRLHSDRAPWSPRWALAASSAVTTARVPTAVESPCLFIPCFEAKAWSPRPTRLPIKGRHRSSSCARASAAPPLSPPRWTRYPVPHCRRRSILAPLYTPTRPPEPSITGIASLLAEIFRLQRPPPPGTAVRRHRWPSRAVQQPKPHP